MESLDVVVNGDIPVERPREASHGDLASPVAMMAASKARMSPRKLAEEIVERISEADEIRDVQVEGPGFINFKITDSYYHGILKEIMEKGEDFGRAAREESESSRIMVEFVSSNPTGPLTVGHGRQAVLGDVIANLLEWTGLGVTREYYFNDAGRQMDLLGKSVYARYAQLFDACFSFPDDGYKGEYIVEIAREIEKEYGDELFSRDGFPGSEILERMRIEATTRIVGMIKQDLNDFRITFDNWYNESTLVNAGKTSESIDRLRKVSAVYEKDGALWFRASAYGDEEDRVLIKGSGQHTYFLTDIAYHIAKRERGYSQTINLHGADHHGYVPRMKAAMAALGYPDSFTKYLVHQMVTLVEGGEKLKMSTRAGTFVTLRELIDKVGVDVARYFFVMTRPESHLVFDLDLARSRSLKNPVYYLQYVNARIASIFKFAEREEYAVDMDTVMKEAEPTMLGEEEMFVARRLSHYPEVIRGACESLEPHRLTTYLEDLASTFHHWYETRRVVGEDRQVTFARLYLCHAVRVILRSTLKILGVAIPDSM